MDNKNSTLLVKRTVKKKDLGKLTIGRITGSVIISLLVSLSIFLIVGVFYTKYIKYPSEKDIVYESTGLYALNNWVSCVKSLEGLSEDSYIAKEVEYANNDDLKINFLKRMLSTVNYIPQDVNKKNVYGNDYIDKTSKSTVTEQSYLDDGELVYLEYVDYSSIEIDSVAVKELMTNMNVSLNDVDYENKIVDVFCQYMLSIDNLPTVKEEHNISLSKTDNGYSVSNEEDIYLDKLLFSSGDFRDLLNRFSEVASGNTLSITSEWKQWDSLSDDVKLVTQEPSKYNKKLSMNLTWCGAYYLSNEYKETVNGETVVGVDANDGDGSFMNPAGIGTSIVTYYIDEKGNKYPIRVTLTEFGVDEDAITWLESKDNRNRGIQLSSEIRYCYYTFKVQNLSNSTITVNDDSSICDSNANCYSRTGTMYGLQESINLKPDEEGIIESWNKSTELDKKYIIWGKSFERKEEPVWFKLLAGNATGSTESNIEKENTEYNTKGSEN